MKAGFDILLSYEDWLLLKNNELVHSRKEIDELPLKTIQHYIGFDIGQNQKEAKERERESRKARNRPHR